MLLQNDITNLKRKLWSAQKEIQRLKNQARRSKEILQKIPFLSEELIERITTGKRRAAWTPQLIKTALKIRFAVGWKGYIYI